MKHHYNIPKPTNTGVLIGAVFVGLLALACNQYRKLDPDALDGWINEIVPKEAVQVVEQPDEVASLAALDPAALIEFASTAELEVSSAYERWLARDFNEIDEARLSQLHEKVLEAYRELTTREEATSFDLRSIKLLRLKAQYQLARILPDRFGTDFQEFAEHLAQAERAADVGVTADVTKFFYEHDPSRLEIAVILRELTSYVRRYERDRVGITVFSLFAEELHRHHRRQAAIQVLRRGIRLYQGRPGVGRLVNQLVDLDE